jgi:hypothetical protein
MTPGGELAEAQVLGASALQPTREKCDAALRDPALRHRIDDGASDSKGRRRKRQFTYDWISRGGPCDHRGYCQGRPWLCHYDVSGALVCTPTTTAKRTRFRSLWFKGPVPQGQTAAIRVPSWLFETTSRSSYSSSIQILESMSHCGRLLTTTGLTQRPSLQQPTLLLLRPTALSPSRWLCGPPSDRSSSEGR